MAHKHFPVYWAAVAVGGEMTIGIENSDGNANVQFCQEDTLERFYARIEARGSPSAISRPTAVRDPRL